MALPERVTEWLRGYSVVGRKCVLKLGRIGTIGVLVEGDTHLSLLDVRLPLDASMVRTFATIELATDEYKRRVIELNHIAQDKYLCDQVEAAKDRGELVGTSGARAAEAEAEYEMSHR